MSLPNRVSHEGGGLRARFGERLRFEALSTHSRVACWRESLPAIVTSLVLHR